MSRLDRAAARAVLHDADTTVAHWADDVLDALDACVVDDQPSWRYAVASRDLAVRDAHRSDVHAQFSTLPDAVAACISLNDGSLLSISVTWTAR